MCIAHVQFLQKFSDKLTFCTNNDSENFYRKLETMMISAICEFCLQVHALPFVKFPSAMFYDDIDA